MPRVDVLTPIHKALRAMTYDCAGSLQCADLADPQEAGWTLDRVEQTLAMVEDHRAHEETGLFPNIADGERDLVASLVAEHEKVGRLIERVQESAADVRGAAGGEARLLAGAELTRRFNEVVASYLRHFAREDAELTPAMHRRLDDSRIIAIRDEIIQSIAPDLYAQQLVWMFRGLNRVEVVGMLAEAKSAAPAPVFAKMATLAEQAMGPERWAVVRRDMGLAAEQAA